MTRPAASVGDAIGPIQLGPITTTDIVRSQGASGDLNPVHFDLNVARANGFEQVLSVGMLHAGLLSTVVTDWLGARNVRRFKVRFTSPVFPGDSLVCRANVVRTFQREEAEFAEVTMRCETLDGRSVIVGRRLCV